MTIVKQLLQDKGSDVWTISPDSTVYTALELMTEKNVGALVVIDSDRVAGIVSERDYARKVVLKQKSAISLPVKEIMTGSVYCVSPDYTIEQCMALMTDKRVRHLPVLEDEQLIGIISIGDVVKAIIANKEFLIEQLESYIGSGG